jgi:uncharacterized protein YdeI (YjbR/CyaY-like superfamily)
VLPRFFATPALFRKWLQEHAATRSELLVGFHKTHTGKPCMTWPESVDEALCFGWIDGLRKRIDAASYTIRFTPRKSTSIWSSINTKRAQGLLEEGRMTPAGRKAFAARRQSRTGVYSHEQRPEQLTEPYASLLAKKPAAARYLAQQPPWYRRAAIWWVISAKKEETRLRRAQTLIELSAKRTWLPHLIRSSPDR